MLSVVWVKSNSSKFCIVFRDVCAPFQCLSPRQKVQSHWAVVACVTSDIRRKRVTAHARNKFHSLVDKDDSAQKLNIGMVYVWSKKCEHLLFIFNAQTYIFHHFLPEDNMLILVSGTTPFNTIVWDIWIKKNVYLRLACSIISLASSIMLYEFIYDAIYFLAESFQTFVMLVIWSTY